MNRPARPRASGRKPMAISMRGSDAWRAWLDGLARHDERPIAKVVEMALRERARAIGYGEEMPPRGGD